MNFEQIKEWYASTMNKTVDQFDEFDLYIAKGIDKFNTEVVKKNDNLHSVSGLLPSDKDIRAKFPVDNNWSVEDKALEIGKRNGARWMRDLLTKKK